MSASSLLKLKGMIKINMAVATVSYSSCEGTLQQKNTVAVEYPQHSITANPTCSSYSSTVL